ncbi:MAG: hypothetical protein A2X01_02015 [Bacteroidetes bacterium GWF2_35_48]|nr:MAG: hypothetical protein A2X01_02015 [Bacteroidetes bacterium GWF2_35_48]
MKTQSSNSLQFQLLEKIKNTLPASSSLVIEISDILGVSQDSAYRRLRGETALTIDEVYKLCSQYKISFDALYSHDADTVSFMYQSLQFNETGFSGYLHSIYEHLKQINKAPSRQVVYMAEDLPIFYHFKYPELAAFKLFYWMKSVMAVPSFEGKKFHASHISDDHIDVCKKIFDSYASVPSVEIWTETTGSSLIKQIEYFWESGQFQHRDDALFICEQVRQEFEFIEKQAALSKKLTDEKNISENAPEYQLYNCELELGNNCILVKMGESKAVYFTHIAFNKLVTTHNSFCNETEDWMKGMIKKSVLISGTSEKLRYRFFAKAFEQLDILVKAIKN